ncbi:acyl carrier protein [Flammeovirga pectinis]|uniref:Acyl carrier protein n=1 Tax=Flammeovirga pectinis TaxID=2494373 RepID=A0A3Q9FK19_9BACT|nr:phosphopantetheine-binding protein [Flammeovirga pectinis]AZQ61909.1 acyl carrier protein [Flammeovirga pectinis]
MKEQISNIINEICDDKGYAKVDVDHHDFEQLKLREDIGFDSFDLATLTVLIEDEFDIDIFEDGIVNTLGEIVQKLK